LKINVLVVVTCSSTLFVGVPFENWVTKRRVQYGNKSKTIIGRTWA
jgi:hypothetical protein